MTLDTTLSELLTGNKVKKAICHPEEIVLILEDDMNIRITSYNLDDGSSVLKASVTMDVDVIVM